MAFNGGDIVVQLIMDDGQYRPAIIRASDVTRAFKSEIEAASKSVQKMESHFTSVGRKFRDTIMTLGALRFAMMDVNDIFLKLPMAILKTAGEIEKTKALLSGLSSEFTKTARDAEGAANFKYISDMAMKAPFQISALSDAFVKLKSGGMDPMNGSLQTLVDGVARFGGSGETLKRASIAIQQMMGKGVVSMEELRQQLGEAVPTAMSAMAEGMRMSMSELANAVSKGTVQAADALNKMFMVMGIRNRGAAQEMMTTWIGLQEQVKTKMTLAAERIAESGFGESAKKALQDISAALDSVEFKRAADTLGSYLKTAVDGLSKIAKFLVEHGEAIKNVAQAWVAYKIVFSGIVPVMTAMRTEYDKLHGAWGKAAERVGSQMVAEKELAMMRTANAAKAAQEQMTSSAASIAAMEKELAFRKAMTAQLQAEMTKLYAPIADGKRPRNDAGQFVSSAAVQAQIRDMSRIEAAHIAAGARITQELDKTKAAHAAAGAQVVAHGTQLDNLQGGATKAAGAMGTMRTAMTAMGTAFNALGGWMTVLNVAIVAGMWAWNKWGNAAEDAIRRAERARKNTSSPEDLAASEADLKGVTKAREALRLKILKMEADGIETGSKELTALNKKNYAKLLAEKKAADTLFDKLTQETATHRAVVTAQNGQEFARGIIQEAERTTGAYRQAAQREMAANDERHKLEIEAAGTNVEKRKAADKRHGDEINYIVLRESNARAATFKKAIDVQNGILKTGNAEQKAIASAALDGLRQNLAATEAEIKRAEDAFKPNQIAAKDKKPKKEKESEFTKELEKLKEDAAKWKAILENVDEITGEGDKVAGDVAKMRQRIANGDFGKITREQAVELINLQVYASNLKKASKDRDDAMKEMAKVEEKRIKDVTRVTEYIAGLQPEIERAAEILADPLGTAEAKAPKETGAKKWVAKNTKEIQEYVAELILSGKDVGATFESVSKSITSGMQKVDVANTFAAIAKETKKLNDDVADETRASMKARAEADDQRHFSMLKNLIEERKAAKASTEEITELTTMMNDHIAAKTRTTMEKFRSPMEKLALEWANVTKRMEEATDKWAGGFMDAIVESVSTGKLQFGSFVESVLKDLLRIQMQQMFRPVVTSAMDSLTSFVGNMLGVSTGGGGVSVSPVYTPSTYGATMLPALTGHANGGIMTEFGSLPLHKYARGGIANRPQAALFGEGSMPEAYVPLPDGRTIPVTMSGKGGGTIESIQVNVINQGGQPMQSSKKDVSTSFDGKKIVLDIVLDAVGQPGPFRDGFKGALMR